jgi:porin
LISPGAADRALGEAKEISSMRSRKVNGVACVLWLCLAAPLFCQVHAQAVNANSLPPTQAFEPPKVSRLFDTWGGVQTGLSDHGVNLQIDAVTEFAGNVSGGVKQGSTFANQIGVQADVNWERLAGVSGFSTHVVVVSRSGSSDSALFGDRFSPVQEVYGSGGNVVLHLVSAYAQETLLDGHLDFAAGRMNVENDFASSVLYCNFINNGLCGDPKALPGGDRGHSAFPDAVWAARVQSLPTADTYVRTGLYQVNQGLYSDANFRTGFKLDDSQTSGAYLPLELGWAPTLGPDKLPGHYKLGFAYDTSSGYMDFGDELAAARVPGFTARSRSGNTQVWALADQMLLRTGPDDVDGLVALAGFIHNDPNNSVYAEQYFAGSVVRGFWRARPQDAIGLLFMYDAVSGRLGSVQDLELSQGLPLSNGATGVQRREMILEANYDIQVFRGVNVEPDFQYVLRPNAQSNIKDAAVFGVRAHVQF